MSYQTQQEELRTRFYDAWAARIPVDYPNLEFTPPTPPAPWCRFRVIGGDSEQTTIGAATNNFRNAGIIAVQVFVPINTGDDLAYQHADAAGDIFENWCGTNITCRAKQVKEVGPDGLGYFQVNVFIPFRRDELR